MSRVLVVDDEPAIGWSLKEMLSDEGHDVDLAANVGEALAATTRHAPDAILLDVRLPGRDGIEAIPDLRAVAGDAAIVVMTAFGDLDTAVRAVRAGACDYLVKPFDLEHVSAVVARAVAERGGGASVGAADAAPPTLVGSSPAMQEVFRAIAVAAGSDLPVLVSGPAGSGRELAARAIHAHSRRHDGPLLVTSLSALAPGTIATELFGGDSTGLVARAAGGTLLVKDIEAATSEVQERLAGLVDSGHGTAPGQEAAPPARLIVTTSRPATATGPWHGLAPTRQPLTIALPPLAARLEDVESLVRTFLARHAATTRTRPTGVSPEFLAAARARAWPGDVRELRAAVEHAAVVARGSTLRPEHLPSDDRGAGGTVDAATRQVGAAIREWAAAARAAFGRLPEPDLHDRTVRLVEATLLREALAHTGGNRTAAARLLGLDRATLRTKLRQLGIDD
jgi:two-component system nitrogen regulation response regulator GlnG